MVERSGAVERSGTVKRSRRVEKSGTLERFDMRVATAVTALGVGKMSPAAVATWSPLGRTSEQGGGPAATQKMGKASPAAVAAGASPARVKEKMAVPVAD